MDNAVVRYTAMISQGMKGTMKHRHGAVNYLTSDLKSKDSYEVESTVLTKHLNDEKLAKMFCCKTNRSIE